MASRRRWRLVAVCALLGVLLATAVMHPVIEFIHLRRTGQTLGRTWIEWVIAPAQTAFSREMVSMSIAWGLAGAFAGGMLALLHLRVSDPNRIAGSLPMPLPDLLALMAQGESEHIEFKSSLRWDWRQQKVNKQLESVIAASVAGFMNHDGGSLLIGVGDDGEITGIEADCATMSRANWDGFERTLMNLLAGRLGAQFGVLVHCHQYHIDAKSICLVAVEKSLGSVYCRDGNIERYFVRTGNTTRELDAREAVEHISRKRSAT